jgi:hypothetical protein
MKVYIALLGLIALLSIAIQPAMATKFSIYVYDTESNTPLQNAFVRVWQGDNLMNCGNTDSQGLFVTYLNDGSKYHIRAEYRNRWVDILDYLANSANSDRIDLKLHN